MEARRYTLEVAIDSMGGLPAEPALAPRRSPFLWSQYLPDALSRAAELPCKFSYGHAEIHNIEKTLRRACRRADVEPFTPHQLRHLFATEMLRNRAKLEVVSRILGHSSIKVTVDVYRSVERQRDARRGG